MDQVRVGRVIFPFRLWIFQESAVSVSRPDAAAAFAIADRVTCIFSEYCKGIRVDFHPPACVIAAKSISSAAKSWEAPTRVECPLTRFTNRSGIPIH